MIRRTPLRIALFPEYFYPHVGGAETWTAHIARCLATLGHDVEVFTYRMPRATSDEIQFDVHVHRIGRPFVIVGARPYFKRFLIHLIGSFLAMMKRDRFDVVIAQYTPLLPLKLVSSVRRIPIVAIFHDVYGLKASIEQKGILRGLVRYIFGDLLITRLRYDGIVAVSDATSEKLRRFHCRTEKIEVVRNAVDVDLIDSIIAAKISKRICFVGRLLKHKHVDELLSAFAIVKEREPNANLVVIGDGDERSKLVSLADELGVKGSVNFTGFVDDEEKIRLMKSSELLVLPSTDEGWGNVITEAIACGLKTVGYDIPALREQTKFFSSLVLVPPGKIDALAQAIGQTLTNGDESSVAVDSALVHSDFTWMRRAEELEQFLREVKEGRD
jgi:glycosyltransferase involved in cell wall biosynthesis